MYARSIPRHVAIIMDGNGRWANQNGFSRSEGHRKGAGRVSEIVEKCLELGVGYLTIYAFSKENWKRPKNEVSSIMELSEVFFRSDFLKLVKKGVYFVHLGERLGLPNFVINVLDNIQKRNSTERKLYLNIAFNYSGRNEIARACRSLAARVRGGEINPEDISEAQIERELYTAGMPDPDLLIRTGGELRVSNFLLWQIAYSEIWVTEVLWPDFSARVFEQAIEDYTKRSRRFGNV
jgi:undecaprenyl diphosphate synthase